MLNGSRRTSHSSIRTTLSMQKRLFLLDAYALIYRSYYAFIKNPRVNSKGLNTSAIFGFTLTLEELLRKEKPSHIAVVFDPPTPTFRHQMYPEYKANRPPMPEELRQSVPWIRKLISTFRIPMLEADGFEADDVIGTLAVKAEKEGFEVFMMTPDKDFAQLVTDKIRMYRPRRSQQENEVLGVEEICREFGISDPLQVVDILALWGDSSDNVPGAPGIGEKTARDLIARYGSVDGVYAHLDELKGKQKENLIAFRGQVERARELVTIHRGAPVEFVAGDLVNQGPDERAVRELFEELEFKTLLSRVIPQSQPTLFQGQPAAATQGSLFDAVQSPPAEKTEEASTRWKTIQNVDHRYHLIDSEKELLNLIPTLLRVKSLCLDTETTGLDALEASLVGLAISHKAGEAWYVLFPDHPEITRNWLKHLSPVFENEQVEKIGQNLKYDLQILANYGVKVKGPLFDTMIAHYLLSPDGTHNLGFLALQYLEYQMVPIEELIGEKGKQQRSMRSVDPEVQKEYAGEDADITFQLKGILEKELEANALMRLFRDVEMPLIPVLAGMERSGIRLNPETLIQYSGELEREIRELEEEIIGLAGIRFNIASPKQLGTVLFEHLRIDPDARLTKTKQYSTSEEVLTHLAGKHPIISKILDYRGLVKLKNTYVDVLPGLIKSATGKIHTQFNQAIAATGRLSSINPNMQNIPIREERGREIRRAFVPTDERHVLLSADYSQIELRIMAHLSQDENMIAAFNREEDIHTATAALIHRVKPQQVTREMRSGAKTANFGIIYGISSFGLAQRLNISRSEAKNLIDGYFRSYPGVKRYMDESIRMAREKGYVTTLMGRKRHLRDIQSQNPVVRGNAERNAINSPVQGSAADIIKLAMVRIARRFDEEKLRSAMVLQVHDELNFDVHLDELTKVREIVRYEMEHAIQISVALLVEMGTGSNWLEAHG